MQMGRNGPLRYSGGVELRHREDGPSATDLHRSFHGYNLQMGSLGPFFLQHFGVSRSIFRLIGEKMYKFWVFQGQNDD